MPEHSSYYRDRERAGRPRTGRRSEPQQSGDSLALSLTAQMIAVLLLLGAVWLLRSMNSEGYYNFRENYGSMTGEQSALEIESATIEDLSRTISRIVNGISGEEVGEVPENELTPISDESEAQVYLSDQDFIPPPGQGTVNAGPLVGTDESGQYIIPDNAWLSPVFFATQMQPPATGRITSPFAWRTHPLTEKPDFHNGIDIAASEGSPILAALPGKVIEVGWSRIYGNYIILQHAPNFKTFYAHCDEITVQEGMAVLRGEKIATVGSTGISTGPHLHFGVIVDDKYVNPYWALSGFIVAGR